MANMIACIYDEKYRDIWNTKKTFKLAYIFVDNPWLTW